MKRPYLLAASFLALVASATSACHRRDDCVSTTSTTSATLTSGEIDVQTPRPAPNASPSPAVTATTLPAITPADLPNAPGSTATTSAATGSTATATDARDAAATSATGPVDISGPTPAAPADGSSTGTTTAAPAANAGAAPATATPAAPLVERGLDNTVTGGAWNTGAPFSYGAASPAPWYGPAPMTTMSRPIGGPMRPGAASDPNTTSGAR